MDKMRPLQRFRATPGGGSAHMDGWWRIQPRCDTPRGPECGGHAAADSCKGGHAARPKPRHGRGSKQRRHGRRTPGPTPRGGAPRPATWRRPPDRSWFRL